jgi:hypothetical protein
VLVEAIGVAFAMKESAIGVEVKATPGEGSGDDNLDATPLQLGRNPQGGLNGSGPVVVDPERIHGHTHATY